MDVHFSQHQPEIWPKIQEWVNAVRRGEQVKPLLFVGTQGTGKTVLTRSILNAIRSASVVYTSVEPAILSGVVKHGVLAWDNISSYFHGTEKAIIEALATRSVVRFRHQGTSKEAEYDLSRVAFVGNALNADFLSPEIRERFEIIELLPFDTSAYIRGSDAVFLITQYLKDKANGTDESTN